MIDVPKNQVLHNAFCASFQAYYLRPMPTPPPAQSKNANINFTPGEFLRRAALDNLPWLPAGVGLEMYQVITPTFGFAGTGLQNFDNGTFATYGITKL